jgi:hypothetical protein
MHKIVCKSALSRRVAFFSCLFILVGENAVDCMYEWLFDIFFLKRFGEPVAAYCMCLVNISVDGVGFFS